jgi:Flp pilus assembly pilin Flp
VETLRRIGKRDSQQEVGTDMVAIINNALLHVYFAASGLASRLRDERGQDLLEYALLGGLIAAAIVGLLAIFTPYLDDMADNIGACIDFASSTPCNPGF